jgi:hypothetical protein
MGSMDAELKDATWELDPREFARALSAKTRKAHAPPPTLNPDFEDQFTNYVVEIDGLDGVLENALGAFLPTNPHPGDPDRQTYGPFCEFLNACLKACRQALGDGGRYHSELTFIEYDREMQDKVKKANPLKPDIAGTINHAGKADGLWWKPPAGERSLMMEIPVKVNGKWKELVRQAATYARCLSDAIPLRHFSLILAYNHTNSSSSMPAASQLQKLFRSTTLLTTRIFFVSFYPC